MYRVTLEVNDRALLWNSLSKSSATSIKKSRAVDARLESFKQGGVKQSGGEPLGAIRSRITLQGIS
jgi:hypothetical protein